jgi:hypothetical protein
MSQTFRLRIVGRRIQVVDAFDDKRVLGVIHGTDTTGYEACKPGGEALPDTEVFISPRAAGTHIYLEFLASLELPATTKEAS